MLTVEKMKEQLEDYQMWFDESQKKVYIAKGCGTVNWVKVSYKRALQWIQVGIDDLDCRTEEEMINLINSWGGEK
jgi:hypothetical protein